MNAPASRRSSLLLLLTLLAAFALRVYQLDAQSLWYDEGVTATLAQRDLAELTAWTARDIQPPLYYYVVAGWGRVAGWSEWSLRFVSAWWGVLLVPLLAVLARRLTQYPSHAGSDGSTRSQDFSLHRLTWQKTKVLTTVSTAALLTAFHPLLIYYSQEARMYMMVVALGVLAGYLFLRATAGAASQRRDWLFYIVVATAAVYTHYFAFFLLLAFVSAGLCAQSNQRTQIRALLAAHLVIALLFAAWIAPLLTQLATDRSYWQGTFKVDEAVHAILLRFVVGETVLAQFAGKYMVIAGAITLFAVAQLLYTAWQGRTHRQTLIFIASWLLLPTLGVLTLAVAVPKFNVRYVLLALPGLILLWSWGATKRVPGTAQTNSIYPDLDGPSPERAARDYRFFVITTLPLLVIFGIATHNWFTDHTFLKAQWREAAAYVRLHQEAEEAVVLVSGHTWPVWEYYALDLPAIRLPDLEILDVEAVLDFTESGPALQAALQGYRGAWLVNWQEEVVDPTGVVPIQLGWAGQEKTFRSQFWEVGLRRFIELDPDAIPTAPPLAERVDANFGNHLLFTGYTTTKDDELLLFWQLAPGVVAPPTDWQISLQTATSAGLPYYSPTDRRPTDYHYPVARWQPGETVMGMIPALAWVGPAAMPGEYQVQLRVYDPAADPAGLDRLNPQGLPLGKTVTLHLTLQEKTTDRPLPEPTAAVEVSNGLRLAIEPTISSGEPGQRFATTLLWYPADDFTPVELAVRWRRVADDTIGASTPLRLPPGPPMRDWPTRDWFRQVIALQVPLDLPAGDYTLALEPVTDPGAKAARGVQQRFTVLPNSRSFTAPPLAEPLQVDLFETTARAAPQLRLLGLRARPSATVDPEAPLTVTLVWQAPVDQAPPMYDYTISLQLLAADGLPAAQIDLPLPGGTSTWLPGEVVTQTVTLAEPPPPGDYRLIVAVYDPARPSNPRLVTAAGANFIELAP